MFACSKFYLAVQYIVADAPLEINIPSGQREAITKAYDALLRLLAAMSSIEDEDATLCPDPDGGSHNTIEMTPMTETTGVCESARYK